MKRCISGYAYNERQDKCVRKKYPKHDCGVNKRVKEERRIRKAQGLDY